METFEQILELDDEEDDSFSWDIVSGYLDQAEATFRKMEVAM